MKLEDYIAVYAQQQPARLALVDARQKLTYAQLQEAVTRQAELFKKEQEQNKSPFIIMRATQTVDFLVKYFAAHLADVAFVPLENDATPQSENEILQLLQKAQIPHGTADILFTTGTTGRQKGVIISHKAILADAENLLEAHQYAHDTTFVICGPLNHIGSLSKVYPTLLAGGSLIITGGMKDMNALLQTMEEAQGKIATFLVPSSIRMLLQFAQERLAAMARKIDFIETGAAAISLSDMQLLGQTLPLTRLYNTYASTETGIITTYNWNTPGGCISGCLGKPMKHSRVIITPEGTIACAGDTLMTGYVGDEDLTRQVLHDDAVYTNDCGHLDAKGMLHLSARLGDVINCGGYKINPLEVEEAALAIAGIKDCICIPFQHPVIGTAPKLLYVLQDGAALKPRDIALALKEVLEAYKVPAAIAQVDKVQRTYNGKLDRKFYLK